MDEDLLTDVWEIAVAADWLDEADALYWLARGKVAVWFDYLDLAKCGLSGADLEQELAQHGVGVYAKQVISSYNGELPAFVLVDPKKEARARRILADWGILL